MLEDIFYRWHTYHTGSRKPDALTSQLADSYRRGAAEAAA